MVAVRFCLELVQPLMSPSDDKGSSTSILIKRVLVEPLAVAACTITDTQGPLQKISLVTYRFVESITISSQRSERNARSRFSARHTNRYVSDHHTLPIYPDQITTIAIRFLFMLCSARSTCENPRLYSPCKSPIKGPMQTQEKATLHCPQTCTHRYKYARCAFTYIFASVYVVLRIDQLKTARAITTATPTTTDKQTTSKPIRIRIEVVIAIAVVHYHHEPILYNAYLIHSA